MKWILTGVGLAGVLAVSQSPARETVNPAIAEAPSAETLAMLDPIRRAVAICSQRAGVSSLAGRLQFASAQTMQSGGGNSGAMPLFDDAPEFQLASASDNESAQAYFNQGLMLTFGFNHHGAIRSFQAAQRLDPECALCWYGEALALGPNINAPMDPAANPAALAAVRQAVARRANTTPEGQALIDAIELRFSDDPAAQRSALDMAYANAMAETAAQFPLNDDIAVLAAEALMDTSPWDYWEPGGRENKGRVGEAVSLIEGVLDRNLDHPQAAHLYIHLMENSEDPTRAELVADRLSGWSAPFAGHLAHMPAHIYYRLGRYEDSIRVNIAATRSDEHYLADVGDDAIYRFGYYPHNVHFIVTSAQMAGDMPTAIRESVRLMRVLDAGVASEIAWIQPIHAAPYMAAAQFADPERVLTLRAADSRLPYVVAIRHYARALAYAQLRDSESFDRELAALNAIRADGDFEVMVAQGVPAPELLTLAEAVARGRMAYAEDRFDDAITLYQEAIAIESALPYTEPPYWYYPVSQSLGAALLAAGRNEEARRAFQAALIKAPVNGWALYGLAAAERALGNPVEAAAADAALERVWLGTPNWLRMDRL
jgi:tetratricopeptide (TPR) repeat protein